MSRVSDEAWIAVIFVLKWIALLLAILFVCYSTIRYLYHALYCDPQIAAIELNIAHLETRSNELNIILSQRQQVHANTYALVDALKEKLQKATESVGAAESELIKAKDGLPMWKQPFDDDVEVAKNLVDKAEASVESLDDELSVRNDELSDITLELESTNEAIHEVTQEIKAKNSEKAQVCVSVGFLIPLAWLFASLID